MPTLRSYLTAAEYAEITSDSSSEVTDQLLDQAETLVDNACAMFYGSVLAKSIDYNEVFEGVTVTNSTATLPSASQNTDYYKYCTIEILNGAKAGHKSLVTSSAGTLLTFNAITGLSGTVAIQISQLGKFPMLKDTHRFSSTVYKTIPQEIKQATAWQVKYLIDNPKLFVTDLLQSESISNNYSYTRGSNLDKKSMITYLAPQTIQLLSPYLLQTI